MTSLLPTIPMPIVVSADWSLPGFRPRKPSRSLNSRVFPIPKCIGMSGRSRTYDCACALATRSNKGIDVRVAGQGFFREGQVIAADLFTPADPVADRKYPAVAICQGFTGI